MGVVLVRRALTLLILTGAALVFMGAAPVERDTMLEQFDRVLTAMAYAAVRPLLSSPSSGRASS